MSNLSAEFYDRWLAVLVAAFAALGVLALLLALMATAAQAQSPPCAPKADIAKTLLDKFGETPVAMGIVGDNQMKFYLDPKDRSWTMLIINPHGMGCIAATGNEFGPITSPEGSGT